MSWTLDAERLDSLERIHEVLKQARAAKKPGANLQPVKELVKQATKAWTARDYATAKDLANRAMEMLGPPPLP